MKTPDPPTFTISAVNRYAAGVVRVWAINSQKGNAASKEEIAEAYEIADEMEDWYEKHGEKR